MRKLLSGALLLAVVVPSLAQAQQRRGAQAGGARHEFGVDLGAYYAKPENVDGGIEIGTPGLPDPLFAPVDLRVGFVTARNLMWEGRLNFAFSSVGGDSRYGLQPGVNVLYAPAPGTHRSGMYLTGGGSILLGDDGTDSGTQLAVNGGVGWRKPWGSAAWRYEIGFRYAFESTDLGLPSTVAIGGRIGVSLWR